MAQSVTEPALTPPNDPRPPEPAAPRRRLRLPRLQEAGLVLVIVALCLLLTFAGGNITIRGHVVNNFFRPDNLLTNVLTPMSWMAIMAVGVTCVVVSGGGDNFGGFLFRLPAPWGAGGVSKPNEEGSAGGNFSVPGFGVVGNWLGF